MRKLPKIETVMRHVEKTDYCWEWTACKCKGYGKTNNFMAHRVVYTLLKGEIPEGLTLDHLCRNKGCVNPDHLEPVTRGENARRGSQFINLTHCLKGHPFSGENLTLIKRRGGFNRKCMECARISDRKRNSTTRNRHIELKKFWYFITVYMCPICGKQERFRERMYTKVPMEWGKRRSLKERYDYCNI